MTKKNNNKRISKTNDILESKKTEDTIKDFSLICTDKVIGDYRNININSFSISINNKKLFEDTSLNISYARRYGLIGANGKGKSTLLNHISNKLLPVDTDLDILIVEQEAPPSDKKVIDFVLDANKKRKKLENDLKKIENIIQSDEDYNPEILNEMNEIRDELISIGSDKDESKVRRILYGMGFDQNDQERPTKHFSGGWRMRIAISKALYMEPTLLLLDEPTNHLDLNAVIWLTEYLSNWKKTLLVVSHNQYFLNDICTDILHIDSLKINNYKGNYYNFIKALKQKRISHEKEWNKLQKRVKEMQKKSVAKKEIQIVITKSGLIKPEKDYIVNINFGEIYNLSTPVLTMNDVCFGYENNNIILQDINFGIDLTSRITIVGPNGAGKSTFINLLVGNLNPKSGIVYRNNKLRIAYYNQHFIDILPMNKTPIEYLQSIDNIHEQELRKMLGTIGLEGSAHIKQINKLSGGQKARVVLVSCQIIQPHILVMDEPTNHLDIESINGLIKAINKFNGGVVIVSHDMELITQTNCVLWVCNNKIIKQYNGEYDDYKDEILNSI